METILTNRWSRSQRLISKYGHNLYFNCHTTTPQPVYHTPPSALPINAGPKRGQRTKRDRCGAEPRTTGSRLSPAASPPPPTLQSTHPSRYARGLLQVLLINTRLTAPLESRPVFNLGSGMIDLIMSEVKLNENKSKHHKSNQTYNQT